jgi:hypothetical protein
MTVELSDAQFDQLIGMMAQTRVDTLTAIDDFRRDLNNRIDDLRSGMGLMHTTLNVIEEDVGKIQVLQREHTQALDGVTELSKTNFDLIESLNKHIHGESSTISHDDRAIRGIPSQ